MKFTEADISMDSMVKEFFLAKNIRESTKNHYLIRLRYYCDFIEKTPSQMIEEAEAEEEERLRMRKRKIRKYFLSWLDELQTKGYSRNTISSFFTSVKTFYRFFEIELPNVNIEIKKDNSKSFEKIPTKEDIKKALNHANIKYKAMILLMSSSGMGSSEIRNLTYGNFLESIKEYYKPTKNEQFDIAQITEVLQEKRTVIPTWKINRFKTGMPYVTFSTPESVEALLVYMNSRQNKNPFKSLNDWLFVSDGTQMSGHVLATYFRRINDKSGFEKLKHSVFFHTHALRKFFGTTLHKKGIQRLNYDFMMGHKIDQIAEAYIKPNVDSLKREYMICIEDLSIESVKFRRIESGEIKTIVNELNEKDRQIKEIREEQKLNDVKMEQTIEEERKRREKLEVMVTELLKKIDDQSK
ncbi:tyrosine-type recombinase/integrase [Methanobacterium subterraneum]|uniref:Tyrosine-type recombinase/integrase n=2 Tax=Methanobacterium subterraneum TaxID=59277 RepID=A0A7K4DME2_9EURY|nr:tyrosine-type recombinase/integrase [Methanobacterium subterraneum]